MNAATRIGVPMTACATMVLALLLSTLLAVSQPAYAQEGYAAGSMGAETPSPETAQVKAPNYAKVAKVRLNRKKATIRNSATVKLRATLVPTVKGKKIRNKTVRWSVSDTKVARVTQTGVVSGKANGTVRVTAKAGNGKRATARIRVVIDQRKMAEAIPVITYHRIASNKAKAAVYRDDGLATSASQFERQLKWLKDNGYRTISTAEFREWRVDGAFLPKKSVLITIDDGYYETYYVAYPILKKLNMKATSFVIGKCTPKKTKRYDPYDPQSHFVGEDVIRKVRATYPNLEFQSHTFDMHHRAANGDGVATVMSRRSIDADFKKNARFGFTALAHPFGHTSRNLLASVSASKSIAIAFGYAMTDPATRVSPRYNIPRFKIAAGISMAAFERIMRTAR